jgi:lipid-A-disaccharide synthase-like uncharacterized protein
MRCDRRSYCMGGYYWYYCWHIGIVFIHTTAYEGLQNQMSDVSIHLMSLIASGMFLWVIYGLIRSDPVIIGTNAAGLALNLSLLVMKLRYDKIQNSVKTT